MNHRKTWNHGGLYHKTTCDYGNEMEKKKKISSVLALPFGWKQSGVCALGWINYISYRACVRVCLQREND